MTLRRRVEEDGYEEDETDYRVLRGEVGVKLAKNRDGIAICYRASLDE